MRPSTEFISPAPLGSRRRRAGAEVLPGRPPRWLAMGFGFAVAALLAGCASTTSAALPTRAAASVAAHWHAPLPHGGQLEDLRRWWAQFDDPLMLGLIEAGQEVSPTVAVAAARIADAGAVRSSSRAALMPTLEASADASRGRSDPGASIGAVASAGLRAGWELDLFGAGRAAAHAAQARLESSRAGWHDARVSVAAEVASTYVELRACEAQVQKAELDAGSRARTARITRLAATAGFLPPTAVDLASASSAQGNAALIQQRARCDLLIKALIALTARDETALRRDLAVGTGVVPRPAELGVTAMPAEVLAQRPDIHAAERDVVAASAESDEAQARRWPRIALGGALGTTRVSGGGVRTDGTVWSIGPVTVTLPLFDGGARRANAKAARARYEAAVTVYAARLREAIRDVEGALVTLSSTAERGDDALGAALGFERSYGAVEASYRVGSASLFELEDARRALVAAQSAVIDLSRERVAAWIALYRALGGGWSAPGGHEARNEAARR